MTKKELFEILFSKIEYKKKKSIKEWEEKYKWIILLINKIINNDINFSKEEKEKLLKVLEYTFKKKLLNIKKEDILKKKKLNKTDIALLNYLFLLY